MTEEVFLEQIDPLPENDYFYYVKGEIYVGVPTFSRAYINFKNQEDIFMFQDKFDGYIFVDQRGNEFPALVEFAPYQKIPRQEQQTKEDKCNTIDNDAHYLEFLQKLENPEQFTLPSAEVYLEQIEQKERELKSMMNADCVMILSLSVLISFYSDFRCWNESQYTIGRIYYKPTTRERKISRREEGRTSAERN